MQEGPLTFVRNCCDVMPKPSNNFTTTKKAEDWTIAAIDRPEGYQTGPSLVDLATACRHHYAVSPLAQ